MDTRLLEVMHRGFLDELEKIAIAAKLTDLKSRAGKRPLRASTLLDKEREGSLYRFMREKSAEGSVGNSIPYSNTDFPGETGKPATAPKAAGEVPSREDGRENQQTRIPGSGRSVLAPAVSNEPAEHGNQ